eukprot:TRINITY_DN67529_c1_g1_i1.p1 TRINITY_DN67529_c1_g1~~TRINITY_DN67529_c1_g1_i1.p1  ORF type:complete len:1221 (+),score=201.53 TRINITY_DN67529_c1_g1_i1:221-3664(+)
MPINTVRSQQQTLMNTLQKVIQTHGHDVKIGIWALRCVQTLYKLTFEYLNTKTIQMLQQVEPSKFNVPVVQVYNEVMQTLYTEINSSHPDVCQKHLPDAIERWSDQLLNDGPEPSANSAAKQIRAVLNTCITPEMVNAFANTPDEAKDKTPLGSICCFLESRLYNSQYSENWDHIADILATVFKRMKKQAIYLRSAIDHLDELRRTGDKRSHTSFEKALGAAVQAIGAEIFFHILPFDALDLEDARATWILPLAGKYVSHDSLVYFMNVVYPLIEQTTGKWKKHSELGDEKNAKSWQFRTEALWKLLPAFCTYPLDLTANDNNMYKDLAQKLTAGMSHSEAIKSSICTAFRLLILKNKRLAEFVPEAEMTDADAEPEEPKEGEDEEDEEVDDVTTLKSRPSASTAGGGLLEERGLGPNADEDDVEQEALHPHEFHGISMEQAKANIAVMQQFDNPVVTRLCNTFERSDEAYRGYILETIKAFVRIAKPQTLSSLHNVVLKHLNDVTPEKLQDQKFVGTILVMCDIGSALMEKSETQQLVNICKPLLPLLKDSKSEEPRLQKKAYRILEKMAYYQREFTLAHLDDVVGVLKGGQTDCRPESRRSRLKIYLNVFNALCDSNPDDLSKILLDSLLSEIILSVRERNRKARNASFSVLHTMSTRLRDIENSAAPFVDCVVNHLKGTTPTMVSCTIVVLARLLLEFRDDLDEKHHRRIIGPILQLLLQQESKEIRNAVLGFCRFVLKLCVVNEVAKEVVREFLPMLMKGVLLWMQSKDVVGVRRRLHVITERCIKRFGYEAVEACVPEAQKRFVVFVNKQYEKDQRKKERALKAEKEKTAISKKAKLTAKFNEIFGDAEGSKLASKQKKNKALMKRKGLMLQTEATAADDLLDPSIVGKFVANPHAARLVTEMQEEDEAEDGFQVGLDPSGRVMISESEAKRQEKAAKLREESGGVFTLDLIKNIQERTTNNTTSKKRKRFGDDDSDDEVVTQKSGLSKKRGAGGSVASGMSASFSSYKPTLGTWDVPSMSNAGAGGANMGFKGVDVGVRTKRKLEKQAAKRQKLERGIKSGGTFKAAKAGGDMVQTQGTDPYAYIPFNAGWLNKRVKTIGGKRFEAKEKKSSKKLPSKMVRGGRNKKKASLKKRAFPAVRK